MSNLLGLEENKTETTGSPASFESDIDPLWDAQVKSGANWFYWIAGLSLVNSLAFVFQANFAFLAGLGLTQLFEAVINVSVQSGAPTALNAVAIVFDVIIVGIFALFGYYAGKGITAVFLIGIIIYVLDALLVLVLGLYPAAAFHAFALFFIIRGYIACRKLKAAQKAVQFQPPPPPSEFL